MLNEIFNRSKQIHKKDNKANNIASTILILVGVAMLISTSIIMILAEAEKDKQDAFSLVVVSLVLIIIFFGIMISSSFKFRKFNKKLELKLTDSKKVDELNKALSDFHSKIIFTEDYLIIFNEDVFETSQVSYIKPILIKERRLAKAVLDVYLKNEKRPKRISLRETRFINQARPIMMELEPAFEKLREANISVEEVTMEKDRLF